MIGRALRAEWLKFGTLASHPITALSALAIIIGLAAVLVWTRAAESSAPTAPELLTGASWAQLLLAVLAVVFVCSEWVSGTSRVTFLAVPRRWPVLLGKATVLGVVSFLVGALGAAGALGVGTLGVGTDVAGRGADLASVAEPAGADAGLAIRLVLGAGIYLGALAVLALGIGTLVRNLIGAILTSIGFLWVLPLAVTLVPVPAAQRIVAVLPVPAGGLLLVAEQLDSPLTAWGGVVVLLAWAGAALACAVLALRTRDI